MTPCAVDRYAKELSLKLLKLIQHFVIERHLIAAHRAPVGRVKCEHYWSPAELVERHRLVWRASQGEVGRPCAGTKHGAVTGIPGDCTHIYRYRGVRSPGRLRWRSRV